MLDSTVYLYHLLTPHQTRTPADSRLIISDPSGCDPSTCNTFIGISTNENNSSFFDFYIEGAAAGWVAVGFSETQSMVGTQGGAEIALLAMYLLWAVSGAEDS